VLSQAHARVIAPEEATRRAAADPVADRSGCRSRTRAEALHVGAAAADAGGLPAAAARPRDHPTAGVPVVHSPSARPGASLSVAPEGRGPKAGCGPTGTLREVHFDTSALGLSDR
jgi:hypothetical protein